MASPLIATVYLLMNVTITRENGKVLSTASGFVVPPHAVLTSFQAIDGAHEVRLIFEDGQERATDRIAAWNRREDWAVVKVDGAGPAALLIYRLSRTTRAAVGTAGSR